MRFDVNILITANLNLSATPLNQNGILFKHLSSNDLDFFVLFFKMFFIGDFTITGHT